MAKGFPQERQTGFEAFYQDAGNLRKERVSVCPSNTLSCTLIVFFLIKNLNIFIIYAMNKRIRFIKHRVTHHKIIYCKTVVTYRNFQV